MIVFICGGSKSGKSSLGQNISKALSKGNNLYYLATMIPVDKEDKEKIRLHVEDRADMGFETIEAGPGEFISYIKNAEKVFTDSFHSSIFSILYHKDIITFKRFEDGGQKDQNARIANLFSKLGIPSYFIGKDEIDKIEEFATPDYTKVEEKLTSYREASRTYLKNAIES